MRGGLLRHRVTLQQLVAASPDQDAGGVPDETWTDLKTVWAAVEPLRGRELIAAQSVQSEAQGTIRIRYRAGITPRMRCVFGTRYYDILAVTNHLERDKELVLMVREGVNNG